VNRALRFVVFLIPAAFFFAIALRGDVYDATSPPDLPGHIVLRKFYSIVAFAIVGAAYSYARRGVTRADGAFAIAIYSGLIEIGQRFDSDELLRWNLFDVACGAVGGALGAELLARFTRLRAGRAK
jgi:hypothetical protein